MKRVQYQIEIDCPRNRVFPIMLDKEHYREWTASFNPTSHYEGSWQEGNHIRFLAENKNGEKDGMLSKIEKLDPYKYISIKHLGMLEKGKETPFDEDFYENYILESKGQASFLTVEIDTKEDWIGYLDNTWPQALKKLKQVCETNC